MTFPVQQLTNDGAHLPLPRGILQMQHSKSTGHGTIQLVLGDIVDQQVDAIVNAANASLLGGGGVDGAIHRAAGPELLDACRQLAVDPDGRRCPTGEARTTPGFGLAAEWVIHAVGPVYDENDHQESCRLLQGAYQASLAEARDRGCQRIAFPAISTGAYQFPLLPAARIAISVAEDSLQHFCWPEQILFVLFSQSDWDFFQAALG